MKRLSRKLVDHDFDFLCELEPDRSIPLTVAAPQALREEEAAWMHFLQSRVPQNFMTDFWEKLALNRDQDTWSAEDVARFYTYLYRSCRPIAYWLDHQYSLSDHLLQGEEELVLLDSDSGGEHCYAEVVRRSQEALLFLDIS